MKNRFCQLLFIVSLALAGVGHAEENIRAFLKIDGIKGESTNPKHLNEIDLGAFKGGVLQTALSGTGGGGGAGKATFQPVVVFKGIDSASPLLFLRCATGQHIPQAVLTVTDNGKEFFEIKLIDVLVTSYDVGSHAAEGDDLPLETVSLNYSRIEITYFPVTSKGTTGEPIRVGFDVLGNTSTAR